MRIYLYYIAILLFCFSSSAGAETNTEKAGDLLRALIPLSAYGATFYMDDKEGRNQFYKSFATNIGVTYGLKQAVDQACPDGADNDSFPSGHASMAFQAASFIQLRYGWKVGIPAYATATFVGWSRLEGDPAEHHTEDVVAGAVIGVVSSYIFTTPYERMTVTPVAGNGIYGVNIRMDW